MQNKYNLITVLGPTASGKTAVAANLASVIDGEIISADSRQVYRGMDLGTGKDYGDYFAGGKKIPFHLIDIADAGYQYNVYEYQRDFFNAFADISKRGKFPVLCGGSGLYIEAVLKNYKLVQVPVNEKLRQELENKPLGELTEILKELKPEMHNITDVENTKRAIRAIEIELYYKENQVAGIDLPTINSLNIGVKFDRLSRRKRITSRLEERLNSGMIDEVKRLLDSGIQPEALIYYGLEYKFLTKYLIGDISYKEMFESLNTAIHQFAKRQMTWFRRMEKQGTQIFWLDGYMPMEDKIGRILKLLNS